MAVNLWDDQGAALVDSRKAGRLSTNPSPRLNKVRCDASSSTRTPLKKAQGQMTRCGCGHQVSSMAMSSPPNETNSPAERAEANSRTPTGKRRSSKIVTILVRPLRWRRRRRREAPGRSQRVPAAVLRLWCTIEGAVNRSSSVVASTTTISGCEERLPLVTTSRKR